MTLAMRGGVSVRFSPAGQVIADSASRRRTARDERLHRLGFDNPGDEQRRRQLATNMALRQWPGR